MGTILIVVIAFALCTYVAIPLLFPSRADPLPDPRDPVEQDLEDEANALVRAIDELELRTDLPEDRRNDLKARYEKKAAAVLRALDKCREASAESEKQTKARAQADAGAAVGAGAAKPVRRVPVAALVLLALMGLTGSVLGGFVLPRIGEGTITIFGSEFEAARALRDLQRAAENEPNAENLLRLGDAYWHQQDAEGARATYGRVVNEVSPVPPLAYRRLAQLIIQEDPERALGYLELARQGDPNDLETLFILGDMYFVTNEFGRAIEVWQDFLAAPGGAGVEVVEARLQVARQLEPLAEAVRDDPSEANLLAYAGALWENEAREQAAGVYLGVLAQHDPEHPLALSRIGQMLFLSGLPTDAAVVLERARRADGHDLDALLFLGNAYFSMERYEAAVDVWEQYVDEAGGPEQAGRVPQLIEDARARMSGGAAGSGAPVSTAPTNAGQTGGAPAEGSGPADSSPDGADVTASGAALFQTHCAACHGADGQGGAGPRLAGNPRLTDAEYAVRTIRSGRGMMPGFQGRLSDGEMRTLADYLEQSFASAEAAPGR